MTISEGSYAIGYVCCMLYLACISAVMIESSIGSCLQHANGAARFLCCSASPAELSHLKHFACKFKISAGMFDAATVVDSMKSNGT